MHINTMPSLMLNPFTVKLLKGEVVIGSDHHKRAAMAMIDDIYKVNKVITDIENYWSDPQQLPSMESYLEEFSEYERKWYDACVTSHVIYTTEEMGLGGIRELYRIHMRRPADFKLDDSQELDALQFVINDDSPIIYDGCEIYLNVEHDDYLKTIDPVNNGGSGDHLKYLASHINPMVVDPTGQWHALLTPTSRPAFDRVLSPVPQGHPFYTLDRYLLINFIAFVYEGYIDAKSTLDEILDFIKTNKLQADKKPL